MTPPTGQKSVQEDPLTDMSASRLRPGGGSDCFHRARRLLYEESRWIYELLVCHRADTRHTHRFLVGSGLPV